MKLLHGLDHVGNVFNDVRCPDLAKTIAMERKRVLIDVRDDVRARTWIAVDAYRSRVFVYAATNI